MLVEWQGVTLERSQVNMQLPWWNGRKQVAYGEVEDCNRRSFIFFYEKVKIFYILEDKGGYFITFYQKNEMSFDLECF